jgi:hypothetical protein
MRAKLLAVREIAVLTGGPAGAITRFGWSPIIFGSTAAKGRRPNSHFAPHPSPAALIAG